MSIQIKFTAIQVLKRVAVNNEQPHLFELEIFSKQHREDMKFTFHTINDGWIELPTNFFILAEGSTISFRMEERNQNKQLEKILSFGEFNSKASELHQQQIESDSSNLRKLAFETFNQKFKIIIAYRCVYDKSRIFSGYFFDLLKNQGHQKLSLISMNQSHQKFNLNKDEAELEFMKQAPQTIRNKPRPSPWSFKNCFKLCDQPDPLSDPSEIAVEQLPPKFSENMHTRHMTPKTKNAVDINQSTGEIQKQSLVKSAQQNGLPVKKEEGHSGIVQMYKGPCKNKNFFSCIDGEVDNQEITIFQPVYR